MNAQQKWKLQSSTHSFVLPARMAHLRWPASGKKKSCDHSRSIYPGYQRFFSRCSAEDTCGEKEKTLTRTSFVVFTRAAKPREKTSGAEHFDLLCWMELDLVSDSNLSIKPAVSYSDHMHKHFSQWKINKLIATTQRNGTAASCSLQEDELKKVWFSLYRSRETHWERWQRETIFRDLHTELL